MIEKNIANSLQNQENIAFLCDLEISGEKFFYTTSFNDINLDKTKYTSGIDDFFLQKQTLSQNEQNWITIAIKSEDLSKFSSIESGFLTLYSIDPDLMKKIKIFTGTITELSTTFQNLVKISFSSMISKFSCEFGDFFSKTCRAEFGDKYCKKDLTNYTFKTDIIKVSSQYQVAISLKKNDGTFTDGYAIFTKNSQTFKTKILIHAGDVITILSLCPFEITMECGLTLILPCGKTTAACAANSNIYNFRGEPFITNS